MRQLFFIGLVNIVLIFFTACNIDSKFKTGESYYIDSAVSGVTYSCGAQQGISDINGTFVFDVGSACKFYLGSIYFKYIEADTLVNQEKLYEDNVTIGRILQSLDSDENLSNGISLDQEIIKALEDSNITSIFDVNLSVIIGIITENNNTFVSKEDAQNHLSATVSNDIIAPVFSSSTSVSVNENQTSALTLLASDENGVEYSIFGTDASSLSVDSSSGVVTFIVAPDYEEKTSYTFTAVAKDILENTATQNIVISIIDVDENVPVFSSSSTVSVNENQTSVLTLLASDVNGVKYSISGTDASTLNVDSSSGIVTFKIAPDYEEKTSYSFTASATDSLNNIVTQEINITILNLIDNIPVLALTTDIRIQDGLTVGTEIVTINTNGINIDENNVTSFTIISGNSDEDFSIDNNGVINLLQVIDYDRTATYSLNIIATNEEGNSSEVTQVITVSRVPIASDFIMNLDINESTATSDWESASSASDPDGDSLSATVKSQGNYGTFVITGTSISYLKTNETNETDTAVLEIDDGTNTIEITVSINALYWKEMSAGAYHTMAIKSDGTLWGWGNNYYGQLGDGTATNATSAVQEETNSTDWLTINCGYYSTAAIKTDNTLYAWGYNVYGQLGDGTNEDSSIPLQESSLSSDWSSVSMSFLHMTAIKSDGTLWSWGYNANGRLGDGTEVTSNVAVQESTQSTDWLRVSSEYGHTVALKNDNTIFSWGENSKGQLGDGSTTDSSIPVQESTLSEEWISIGTGIYHTVALKSDNTLYAWGRNTEGELGNGTTDDSSEPVQENTFSTDWSSIGVGYYHTVGIKSDKTLYAWGKNEYGQLGDGTIVDSNTPIQESTKSTDWLKLIAGSNFTTALKSDNSRYSWGRNYSGQLGNGTITDASTPVQEITAGSMWSNVNTGHYHTVAIKEDGTLWSWGRNESGQLGNGTNLDSAVGVQESTQSTDWSSVSVGEYHSVAIKNDGTLWAWGYNNRGQLGDGTETNSNTPVQESTLNSNWSSVSARANHTVAIKSDNTLYAWGRNNYGQLGNAVSVETSVPTQESSLSNDWSSVSTGEYHTVAIKSDNTLYAWGRNNVGQLGEGTTSTTGYPTQEITNTTDWLRVSAGRYHTVAIKTDNTLYAWGSNSVGELGNGTGLPSSIPLQESTLSDDWLSVSAGQYYTVALKTDNTLYAWGDNDKGQLGDGTKIEKSSPVQEDTKSSWLNISAGYRNVMAIEDDGTLWGWGYNNYGQATTWVVNPRLIEIRE